MIDTMRFKIEGSVEIYNAIKNKGIGKVLWDYENDTQKQVLVYQLLSVPRSFYKIYIQSQDYYNFFIEFSLPKFYFGTNIFMIYPSQVVNILLEVHQLLESFLKQPVAGPQVWIVQRVDYCYVWKFENYLYANWVLYSLSKYNYPRLNTVLYPTTLDHKGSTQKYEFYLKHDEFKAKEYSKLKKDGHVELANYLLEQSMNTLRYEIVQKKPKLKSLFGKEVTFSEVIAQSYIEKTLRDGLKAIVNSSNLVSMTYPEALNIIYENLEARKAFNLTGFLNTWYPVDYATRMHNRKFLKEKLSQSTISKYKKKLRELDIGILVDKTDTKGFDLSIPSKKVINTSGDVADIAVAIRNLKNK